MSVTTASIFSNGKLMASTYEVMSIDIVKEVNRIPYAQIILLDGDAAKQEFAISDDTFFEPGREIEIKLRYEGKPDSEKSVFKGLVVKQIVEANPTGMLLTVEIKDAALKLTQARRSEVYQKKTDSEIFSDLISKGGLKKGSLDSTEAKHPELVQYYCTDWDFMLTRADACGLVVITEDGEISVKKLALNGQPKHTFTFGIDVIYSFEIALDATHQCESVESIAWDLKNQKLTQVSKAKSFELSQGNLKAATVAKAVGSKVQTLSSPVPLDPKALQAWADAAMLKSRMSMIRGCITVEGSNTIRCLDPIKILGVGKRFNGQTVVTGVRHRVDLHGWQTDVQFGLSADWFITRPDVMELPAAGQLPGVHGLQIGIVDQFEEDPDKEFRVKVILPGIDEKKGVVWARLASPDAGKERGCFFRPEPGDEVVMGFFNDDPRQPVILGAMYGSKNTPPKDMKVSKDNIEKGIVSKTGVVIGFKDDKKPAIFIQTPGSNKILIDDDGQMIKIADQHGNSITMSKDGIEVKSAKDLKFDASGNVEIKGSKVDIK